MLMSKNVNNDVSKDSPIGCGSHTVTCYSLSVHHKTNPTGANEGEISCKQRNSKK